MTSYIVDGKPDFHSSNMKYLKWSTEPPTQEGWYWVYDKSSIVEDEPIMLYVYRNVEGILVVPHYDESDLPVSNFKYWLGPLPVPEPPKVDE